MQDVSDANMAPVTDPQTAKFLSDGKQRAVVTQVPEEGPTMHAKTIDVHLHHQDQSWDRRLWDPFHPPKHHVRPWHQRNNSDASNEHEKSLTVWLDMIHTNGGEI